MEAGATKLDWTYGMLNGDMSGAPCEKRAKLELGVKADAIEYWLEGNMCRGGKGNICM